MGVVAGRAAAVLARNLHEPQAQLRIRGLLAGRGEERALRRTGATALLRDLEPALHRPGLLEQRLDLVELAGGEELDLPRHAVGGVDPADQLLDLGELETGPLRDPDEAELAEHRRVVAALPVHALRLREQGDALVVPDRGRRDPGAPRHFSDRQLRQLIHRGQPLT
jgi:hypothetical protein